MHFIQVLQRKETWQFDITSAIIGAVAAWLIVAIVYSQRHQIKSVSEQAWAPIKEWRRKTTAGQGEKYIKALQENVKSLLLFQPKHPELVFNPPVFRAPPALPKTLAEAAETPPFIDVPYEKLLDGASRIVVTGPLGSGRTTALVMTIWETVKRAEEGLPFERIPIWIDLKNISALLDTDKATPLDRLVQLAVLAMPKVSTNWLQQQLRKTPSVILLDNWEVLPRDDRGIVATWIAEVAKELTNSHWIVASDTRGYGILIEVGFVPVQLQTGWTDTKFRNLLQGWSKHLNVDALPEDNEVIKGLMLASKTDAAPLELVLRSVLYLKTGKFPRKPVDTLDFLLEIALPTPNLGDDVEEVSNQARMIALRIITQVAKIHRLENRWVTQQQLIDISNENLPAKEDRHKKLEGAVRKLLSNTQLLSAQNKQWIISHYVWEDFLTAWHLSQEEIGLDFIHTHLNNPSWSLLIEYYVGIAEDSRMLVETTLGNAAIYNDHALLLQASRWAIVAPEPCPWCSEVIKTLAKHFIKGGTHPDTRLLYGKYISIVAGESSRAFFIKMLSAPEIEVRSAALRGLGWSGSPREMAILSAALNDTTFEIQRSAVFGLRDLGTPGATTLLEGYLVSASEELAPIIAQALVVMPDGHRVLQEAVQHPDLLVRRAAVHGLGQINEPWAIELVEEIIRTDPQWLVRSAAETAISLQQEELDNQTLILPQPKAEEVEWLIRWAARQGAGLGVGEAAFTMLIRAIQQGNANTKLLGILTLNQIGRQDHLSVLQPLLHDPDNLVKAQTSEVIQNITQRYQIYLGS